MNVMRGVRCAGATKRRSSIGARQNRTRVESRAAALQRLGGSFIEFGCGHGELGRALLARSPTARWRGFDAAGDIEEATGGFVGYADATTLPLSLPRAQWAIWGVRWGRSAAPTADELRMAARNMYAHGLKGAILTGGRAWVGPLKSVLRETLGYRGGALVDGGDGSDLLVLHRPRQRSRTTAPGRRLESSRVPQASDLQLSGLAAGADFITLQDFDAVRGFGTAPPAWQQPTAVCAAMAKNIVWAVATMPGAPRERHLNVQRMQREMEGRLLLLRGHDARSARTLRMFRQAGVFISDRYNGPVGADLAAQWKRSLWAQGLDPGDSQVHMGKIGHWGTSIDFEQNLHARWVSDGSRDRCRWGVLIQDDMRFTAQHAAQIACALMGAGRKPAARIWLFAHDDSVHAVDAKRVPALLDAYRKGLFAPTDGYPPRMKSAARRFAPAAAERCSGA